MCPKESMQQDCSQYRTQALSLSNLVPQHRNFILEYKKEKEQKLRQISGLSILSPYSNEMDWNSRIATVAYKINKNVGLIRVTTFTHQELIEYHKENNLFYA